MNRYRLASAARRLVAFVCLNVRKLWRQCDAASAECGAFSLVKTQRFDPPDTIQNMRRRGLSTTDPDGHPVKRDDFSLPILASRLRYVGTCTMRNAQNNLITHRQDTVDFAAGEMSIQEEADLDTLLVPRQFLAQHFRQ